MFTREERKQQIINFLNTQQQPLSIGEVGKGVGLKRSPYLRNMLADLAYQGLVLAQWHDHPQWGRTLFYSTDWSYGK